MYIVLTSYNVLSSFICSFPHPVWYKIREWVAIFGELHAILILGFEVIASPCSTIFKSLESTVWCRLWKSTRVLELVTRTSGKKTMQIIITFSIYYSFFSLQNNSSKTRRLSKIQARILASKSQQSSAQSGGLYRLGSSAKWIGVTTKKRITSTKQSSNACRWSGK